MTGVAEKMNQAIALLTEGRKGEARELLGQVVAQDAENEQAWLWMSRAASTDRQRRVCLETVLEINPDNKAATQRIAALQDRLMDQSGDRPDYREAESTAQVTGSGDHGRDAGTSGSVRTTRVVAIVALSVMITCLVGVLLTRYWGIKLPASLGAEPTQVPSPTADASQLIKEYLEESAPPLSRWEDSLEDFIDTMGSADDLESIASPGWQAEAKLDIEKILEAQDRFLDIRPPEPLQRFHRKMSEAARGFERASELFLSSWKTQDPSVGDQAISELQLAILQLDQAQRLLNQTLAEYSLEDYEW